MPPRLSFCPRLLPAVLLTLVAACAGSAGTPRPPETSRVPMVRDPSAPPWEIREPGRRRSQRIRISAELVSRLDSTARRDSLESTLEVAWGDVPDALPARLAGMVTQFEIRVPPLTQWQRPQGISLPFSFVAEQVPGEMPRFRTPDGASCTDLHATVVQGFREAWMALPLRLEPGQAWQDSSRYVMCRDGIPLNVETVRRFVADSAAERAGALVLFLRRRTSTTLRGEGLQFGERITLTGEGEGEMALLVSLDGGAIVAAEGRSVLHVRMDGRRRQQQLLQTSAIEISEPQ
ncbi:MAG: hypothetical protein KF709_07040 [Gemmatimonadaceae bacterium]|nr:hypothetical protein [Gemmatimonadaceae bacterium]